MISTSVSRLDALNDPGGKRSYMANVNSPRLSVVTRGGGSSNALRTPSTAFQVWSEKYFVTEKVCGTTMGLAGNQFMASSVPVCEVNTYPLPTSRPCGSDECPGQYRQ